MQEDVLVRIHAQTQPLNRSMGETQRIVARTRQKMGGDLRQIDGGFRSMNSTAERSIRVLRRLAGIAAASFGVRQIVQWSDAMTRASSQLRVVAGSTEAAARAQDRLFAVSQKTRTSFEANVTLYSRLAIAARELGTGEEELIRFTEGVGQALAVTGTSGAQASGALLQLSQAIGSGIVRAEEFNSILEGAPRIAQAVAEGMDGIGGSVAALRNRILAGEVTSREFFEAFMSQLPALQEEFSRTGTTIGQAMTKLDNAMARAIGLANESTGALSAVAEAISYVADNMNILAGVAAGVATTAMIRFAGAARVASGAVAGLTAMLLANPFTLVATAIGVAVGGLIAFRDKSVEVGGVTVRVGGVLDGIWTTVSETIAGTVMWIGNLVQALGRLLVLDLDGAWESFTQGGRAIIESGQAIIDSWSAAFGAIEETVEDAGETLTGGGSGSGGVISEWADDVAKKFAALRDRLDPLGAATRSYREELDLLLQAEKNGAITSAQRLEMIEKLGAETWAARNPLQALNKELADERRLIGLTEEEREVHTRMLEIENQLRERGVELTAQSRAELEAEVRAIARSRKERDAKAKADKEREADLKRQAEEAEKLLRQPFENFIESTQRATSDMFEDIFSGGVDSFSDLFQTVKRLGFRFAAEMAALLVFQPSVVGGLGSMFGVGSAGGSAAAGGMGGLGGIGNLFSAGSMANNAGLFGNTFSGIGSSISGVLNTPLYTTQATGLIGTVNVPGMTIGGALGAGGLGAMGGGLIAQLTGGNQIGGSIGGGLGAIAGTMIGGPIGGIIGGAAGGFLGGMFGGGGQSVGPIGHTNIVNRGGRLAVGSSGADNGASTDATIQAAQQAVQALNALADRFELTIRSAGPGMISQGAAGGPQSADAFVSQFVAGRGFGSDSATQSAILRNARASSIEALSDALEFGEFYDAVVAAEPALTQVEQGMRELSETFRTASERAKDFGLSVSDLTDGFRTSFERDVADAIRAIEDPFGLALDVQRRDAEARLEMAKELGAELADVERLNALERQKIVEQSLGNLRAWLDGQAITSGATTGVGRLAEAQGQFGDVLDAIRGGDRTQANLSRVTSLADTIIGLGAEIFGGTAQRAALEQMVRSQVEEIGRLMDVPGFASGGYHAGGWRIVGERGPELEFTGPSRIMSASQTREAMGSGLTREDARMMVRYMAEAANGNRQVVAAVDGMSDRIDRLSRDVSRVLTSQTQQRKAG